MAFYIIDKDEGCAMTTKDSHNDHGTITTKGLDKVMGSLGDNPTKVEVPEDVWWQCDLIGSQLKMAPISDTEEELTEFSYMKLYGQERPSFYRDSFDVLQVPKVDAIKKDLGQRSMRRNRRVPSPLDEEYLQERPSFYTDSLGVLRVPKVDAIKQCSMRMYIKRYGQERPSFYKDSLGVFRVPKVDAIKEELGQISMRRNRWGPSPLDEEYLLSYASFKGWESGNIDSE